MVSPAINAYIALQKARQRLAEADKNVLDAYTALQCALKESGPYPTHGWHRQRLAAREDALCHALEQYRYVLGQVSLVFSGLSLRPPF